MNDNTLITPPRKLVAQWIAEGNRQEYCTTNEYLIDKVARWGYERRGAVNEAELQKARDEELEACCEWMRQSYQDGFTADLLRSARRPKPPSLKEQALYALDEALSSDCIHLKGVGDTIRRALESLPD